LHPAPGIPAQIFEVEVLWGTGSDCLTLYNRDMGILDPLGLYPRIPPMPIKTANGTIFRDGLIVEARLLNTDRITAVGERFQELAAIVPNEILTDQIGAPILDAGGNLSFVDNRLSGRNFRNVMFYGSSKYDDHLVFATNKTGIVANISAR